MEPPTAPASVEFARVVWASHILSYMNPYTTTTPDNCLQATTSESDLDKAGSDEDSDDGTDLDEEIDAKIASENTDLLTPYDTNIREKFLNCVAELLSHSKGGAAVTATTLREKENSVEVDLSRNSGFRVQDERYLSALTDFLASAGTSKRSGKSVISWTVYRGLNREVDTAGHGETKEDLHSFLEMTIDYNANRINSWIQTAQSLVKRTPLGLLAQKKFQHQNENGPVPSGAVPRQGKQPLLQSNPFYGILSFGMRRNQMPGKPMQRSERSWLCQVLQSVPPRVHEHSSGHLSPRSIRASYSFGGHVWRGQSQFSVTSSPFQNSYPTSAKSGSFP